MKFLVTIFIISISIISIISITFSLAFTYSTYVEANVNDEDDDIIMEDANPQLMEEVVDRGDKTLPASCFESINLDPLEGKFYVDYLTKSQKTFSTTSLRKEHKSTLSNSNWEKIVRRLKTKESVDDIPINLTLRDIPSLHSKNYTFTFYGKKARFQNDSIKTKIKLRARFYLESKEGATLRNGKEIKFVKRSLTTAKEGWLELKIQNPTPNTQLAVNKYRIMISDKDLIKLFSMDSSSNIFSQFIEELRFKAKENKQNDPSTVDAMLNVIKKIAIKDNEFIHPKLAISYERFAYQFNEKDKNGKIFNHQITMDKDVTFLVPNFKINRGKIGIQNFIYDPNSFKIASYLPDVAVIEYKDPHSFSSSEVNQVNQVNQVNRVNRVNRVTNVQKVFQKKLLTPMRELILPGFKVDSGKAYHFNKIAN
ncbi:MAG: hypothetical protein HQK49_09970 [Oligoflexia bacterium]|nr:hypothetical protein [Oligoflexia bacterium]